MKEIWVLSTKTSLPSTSKRSDELKTYISAYDSFEKGREAMREKIKGYAFTKNSMFNGEGKITGLDDYVNDMDDEEFDDFVLSKKTLVNIQNALIEAFAGRDTALETEDGSYTDWMIAVDVSDNSIRFYGDDDGPCNGYDPVLATNIFSMEEEQDYYLYIDDLFGQDEYSSELYIDLIKTELL